MIEKAAMLDAIREAQRDGEVRVGTTLSVIYPQVYTPTTEQSFQEMIWNMWRGLPILDMRRSEPFIVTPELLNESKSGG